MKAHVSNGCKPCPFCGAPVTVRLMRKGPDFIACTNKQGCGAIVSFNTVYRWKWPWDLIYRDGGIIRWAYLPQPPQKQEDATDGATEQQC